MSLNLFWDRAGNALITSAANGARVKLPDFVKGDKVPLQLTILDPTETAYESLDEETRPIAVRVGVGPLGGPEVAYSDLVYDGISMVWDGLIDLNTAEVAALVTNAKVNTYFSIRGSWSTGFITHISNCSIYPNVLTDGSVSVTPADEYWTKDEADLRFPVLADGAATLRAIKVRNRTTGKYHLVNLEGSDIVQWAFGDGEDLE